MAQIVSAPMHITLKVTSISNTQIGDFPKILKALRETGFGVIASGGTFMPTQISITDLERTKLE